MANGRIEISIEILKFYRSFEKKPLVADRTINLFFLFLKRDQSAVYN
jgi:hypothetical protein